MTFGKRSEKWLVYFSIPFLMEKVIISDLIIVDNMAKTNWLSNQQIIYHWVFCIIMTQLLEKPRVFEDIFCNKTITSPVMNSNMKQMIIRRNLCHSER